MPGGTGPGKVQVKRIPVPGVGPVVGKGITAVTTGPGGLDTEPMAMN